MFEARASSRRVWVVGAVIASAGVGLAIACDSSSDSPPPEPDAAPAPAAEGSVTCPAVAPDAGSSCALPTGTTCAFGQCGGVFFSCRSGVWNAAPVTPEPSVCPAAVPDAGMDCPACFYPDASCLYENGCSNNAGIGAIRASCGASGWHLATVACTANIIGDGGDPNDAADVATNDADASDARD